MFEPSVSLRDINENTGLTIEAVWPEGKASVWVHITQAGKGTMSAELDLKDLEFLANKFSQYDQKAKAWHRANENDLRLPSLGEVWRDKFTGEKFCLNPKRLDVVSNNREGFDFVCSRPHEDGDLSYLCGMSYCRCSQ